jgi:hypothetical protein
MGSEEFLNRESVISVCRSIQNRYGLSPHILLDTNTNLQHSVARPLQIVEENVSKWVTAIDPKQRRLKFRQWPKSLHHLSKSIFRADFDSFDKRRRKMADPLRYLGQRLLFVRSHNHRRCSLQSALHF